MSIITESHAQQFKDSAIEQLQLLGCKDGESVFFRAIADNKPRKLSANFPVIPSELSTLSDEGFNIYLVVNGGGNKDADVITCKAIFYEHDDLPKENQLYLWQSLGLPEPTFQVDTGGKSIHSYWVFDEPIAVDLWKPLQTDLLNFSGADRTIKNPSRVMRLAGFKHQKTGVVASIVSKSGTKYSYDELRSLVPPTPVAVKETKQKHKQDRKPPTPRAVNPSTVAIPLENCLAHSNRDLLRGVSEGGRNDSGATLARDLIGTANYLDSIGTLYIGDARSMFDDFCSRCNPPLDDIEADAIWRSAEGDNPTASCNEGGYPGIDNVLAAWSKNSPQAKAEKKTATNSRFTSSIESGLVKSNFDEDGTERGNPESIGNHLAAIACVDNPDKDGAALLLEFKTYKGDIRRWTMLRAYLAGDGSAIAEGLLSRGYNFKRKQKGALLDYIQGLGADVEKTYTITDSSGWVGKSFVLPHKTYGDETLKFRDVETSPDAMTEAKGSLAEWNHHIGSKCQSNSRMTFVVGMAFAAPLLPLVGMEPGGIHLVGNTSEGKSTLLKVANSVTGGKEVQSWRSTANGLEAIATAHNHILLPIDELGQAEKAVGEAIYMLGNGHGKTRMTKQLANRKPKTWQLLFLSSGEIGLGEYMAQAGITQKGGQEVRMPSIPAVPNGSPFGAFEAIHGCDDSKEFATNLEAACHKHHGAAMDAFLARLVIDRADEKFIQTLRSRVSGVAKKLAEGTKDHAVSRVASRFALTQVALELAHSYGILSFSVENIEWSVNKMFSDWLDSRGGDGSIEIKKACDRIHHLIVSNEFSDRVFDLKKADGQIVRNLLGYKVVGIENETLELLVPTTVFEKEFCNGVNKSQLIAELQARGWLAPEGNDGSSTHPRRINGKLKRFLVFQTPKMSDCEKAGVTGVTGATVPETHVESDFIPINAVTPAKKEGVTGVTVGDRVKAMNRKGIVKDTRIETFVLPKSGEQTTKQHLIEFDDKNSRWLDWDVVEPTD